MTSAPQFSFRSIRDQRPFKFAAIASFAFALILATIALTLRIGQSIDNSMFNIMMVMAALLLLESLILPKILGRVRGRKYEFYDDHMKYIISSERAFTIPYDQLGEVRRAPITKTNRFKNVQVSDIFIKIDRDKAKAFANTVIYKDELKLPAVPESENPLTRIEAILRDYRDRNMTGAV